MRGIILCALLLGVCVTLDCDEGECNVAVGGIASQSSVGWGGYASRGIDGKTSGKWGDRSCTHSRYNKNNKWQVKLAGFLFDHSYPVDRVVIHNRADCCSDRIRGAKVYTKKGNDTMELCGTVPSTGSSKGPFTIECNGKIATDIIVVQTSQYLTLCEVQVFVKESDVPVSDYVNFAGKGDASQSSVGWSGVASRAIDGNTNGAWSGASCTHTQKKTTNTWSVSFPNQLFGAKYPIYKVVIYNRADCCADRINNAKVWVDDQLCGQVKYVAGQGTYVIDCDNKEGGKVSVSLDNQYLTLCEVEVYVKKDKAVVAAVDYVNFAGKGVASQSSVGWSGVASRAIDGNTNGAWGGASCTHTQKKTTNTWSVSFPNQLFGAKYPIYKVVIYNRADCCSDRINNAKVWVDDQMCGQVKYVAGQGTYVIDCDNKEGGKVSVSLDNQYLTLCEVEVYVHKDKAVVQAVDYVNVAGKGVATQTSVGWSGVASRAIDGNTNGVWGGASCTHTQKQSSNKWSVSLPNALFGAKYPVKSVVIYNRADCCSDRINNAKVWLDDQMCGQVKYVAGQGTYVIDCDDKEGGTVSVSLDNQYLTLCEVEVYVHKNKTDPEVESYTNVAIDGVATQSSMGWSGVAARGNDGNTNGQWNGKSCTHSRYNKNNRWSLALAGSDVGVTYPISKVVIYNRQDCCSDRIGGAKIWLDGSMVGEVKYDGSAYYMFDIKEKEGGVITIQNDNSYLTLCEVEVYVKEADVPSVPVITNIASSGYATQSSEGWGGKAARATDGKTNGQWSGGSCTHSRYNKNNWWKLSFKANVSVNAVKIYNRMDCCQDRINGAEVYVGSTKCGTIKYNYQSSYVVSCGDSAVEANSVTIKLDNNYLTLCEVQVLVAEEMGTEVVDEE